MQDTKNILIINYEFPPLGGGGGVAAEKLARGFIKLGYNVDYLTSGHKKLPSEETINGINIFRSKIIGRRKLTTANMLSMFSFLITASWLGIKLCRKNKYILINTHFVLPTGPLGYILSKLFNINNILSLHGGDIFDPSKITSPHRHPSLQRIITFLINNAYAVVAQSQNTKNNTKKYYQVQNNISVIPLPYEMENFSNKPREKLNLKPEKKYLISVGRLVKRKGFEYLISSLECLDKEIELILIGNGPELENLKKIAKQKRVNHKVHFLGQISNEKKFQYLAQADIYVLSSLHEGFGIVLQEAMQAKLPIIATNNGGHTDFIKDGINGLIVEPEDPEEIASKIKFLIANKDKVNGFINHNDDLLKNYSLENIANKYLKHIE